MTRGLTVSADSRDKAPMGFKVRAFIYLVGVHVIAAFFFLIFHLAGAK
ncbi:hypothetical protein SAMN05216252_13092 [Actinacidiphila glaucinigra]|uniref:Small hydrophobic protein n=1 Tax=Actinacidiphila glaucinigra TaxID=235986 RepID=A0A239N2Y1_9ACTN|nr:hypothetical protein SAMN05216252_13092 [Actinacidiphila glaucinigra]